MRIATIAVLLLAALLAGCASHTLSEAECQHANWQLIGLEDGARGYTLAYLGRHREACAEYGISPDLAAYQRGHAEGMKQYCVPSVGFRAGRQGHSYSGQCPPALEPTFLAAYREGQDIRSVDLQVRQLSGALNADHKALDELHADMDAAEHALVDPETPAEQRVQLLIDIKQMHDAIGALEAGLAGREEQLAEREAYRDYLLNEAQYYH